MKEWGKGQRAKSTSQVNSCESSRSQAGERQQSKWEGASVSGQQRKGQGHRADSSPTPAPTCRDKHERELCITRDSQSLGEPETCDFWSNFLVSKY